MSPVLTKEAYAQHLARLHGFYGAFERQAADVDGLVDWLGDIDERLVKTAMIEADLRSLGSSDPENEDLEGYSIDDVASALGAFYVIEGSTLGGRIIGRQLERSLGVTQADGAAFYHSYGDDRGPKWAAFKGVLDRFGEEHPDKTDAVVEAASGTFDAMERWMAASFV